MSYLRLNAQYQSRITTHTTRDPKRARAELAEFATAYPGAPKGIKASARMQLANATIGQPVSAFWHEVLSDWARQLPVATISTMPPARAIVKASGESATLVRWLPGEVPSMTLPTGQKFWKSTAICYHLGLKEDHASKHKGTLDAEDYTLERNPDGRQSMWVTKRGVLKLIVRSRDAGVKGTFLNLLLNQILDVYVDFTDTGVVAHPAAEAPEVEQHLLAAVNADRSQELEQALAEARRLRTEVRRLTYALESEGIREVEGQLLPPPSERGQGPPTLSDSGPPQWG